MWERACSRMRCVSHHMCWLNHRIREQARSHILAAFQIRMVGAFAQSISLAGTGRPNQ